MGDNASSSSFFSSLSHPPIVLLSPPSPRRMPIVIWLMAPTCLLLLLLHPPSHGFEGRGKKRRAVPEERRTPRRHLPKVNARLNTHFRTDYPLGESRRRGPRPFASPFFPPRGRAPIYFIVSRFPPSPFPSFSSPPSHPSFQKGCLGREMM